jgi:hypothetical protein
MKMKMKMIMRRRYYFLRFTFPYSERPEIPSKRLLGGFWGSKSLRYS